MKKLLVFLAVFSVMMIGVAAIAQDNMGQSSTPKAAAAPLKTLRGTVKVEGDKVTFTSDKDQKSWDVINPEKLKEHDGHHVEITAHVYKDKGAIHVMTVKMLK
jgi:ABC-type glycerol-3-phosphate transport system substrate-binding protein